MTSPKLPLSEDDFAQGVITYVDNLPDAQGLNRIAIAVKLDFSVLTTGVIDTGAKYCIFHPDEIADLSVEFLHDEERTIGGYTNKKGKVGRINISLEAEEGIGIEVDATVWIPELQHGENWNVPNLIGYTGFLERIRFAVDPISNSFYFGS